MALSTISGTTGITDATITSAKLADFSAAVDLNGVELILDADQDTTITADTDDRIDFKIAGVEHFSFSNSSGDSIIKPMTDTKDIIFQQYDGNKVFEINDGNYVGVGGNATAAGAIRIYEDTDNGSHYSGFTVGNLTASVTYALPNADGSSGQALSTNGSGVLSWTTVSANTPSSADGQALGSASLEWSDLFLADASTIQFGADQDVTLTHVADTGLLLNTASVIQFRDSAINIGSPADGDLDINADDEIELNSTLVDINANADISGTLTLGGNLIVGSATVTEAQLEILDGATVTTTELNLIDGGATIGTTAFADGDGILHNDGGTMRVTSATTLKTYMSDLTLTTAAQTNITSVGTLTALTVDNMVHNGDAIVMTPSTNDTVTMTAATNGAFSLVTVDTAAAAANIQITADGTFEVDATTITLDSAGDINLDAGGNNITLKSGGTSILDFVNSSSDVIIKPMVDAKDIIFQQRDGTSILEINDGAYARFTAAAVAPEATLTDASTVTWNSLTQSVAKVTLGGNRTMGLASGGVTGAFISLLVIQDGTGSRTITWNAAYEFAADTAPTLTTTANLGDLFVFRYNGAKWLETGRNLALVLS